MYRNQDKQNKKKVFPAFQDNELQLLPITEALVFPYTS